MHIFALKKNLSKYCTDIVRVQAMKILPDTIALRAVLPFFSKQLDILQSRQKELLVTHKLKSLYNYLVPFSFLFIRFMFHSLMSIFYAFSWVSQVLKEERKLRQLSFIVNEETCCEGCKKKIART